jgi:D-tyrosyl-tRNA(Tyr) deacylase
MRILLQRVSRAEVRIRESGGTRLSGHIERGYLLLLGVTHGDGEAEAAWLAEKVTGLRLFADAEEKMNLALADVGGAVLVVSQFTLYGDAAKGRRPSFIDAARPEHARPLYERFVALLRARGVRVETGEFGAMMDVALVNDGPVTLWLERGGGESAE